MSGFRADPECLAQHGREFQGLAERADALHRDLTAALEAAGPCWGGDEVGASFSAVHLGPAGDTLGRLAALGGRLGDVGARFTAMAESYRTVDEDAARGVTAADPSITT